MFLRFFVLFDRKVGKVVARYQQFFGIRALLKRIQQRRPDGGREGGIVWHTTGSGKSFTMVFLTKALVVHDDLKACRVVVVTDRVDLEDQLARNFISSGAFGSAIATKKEGEKARAQTGRQLAKRIGQPTARSPSLTAVAECSLFNLPQEGTGREFAFVGQESSRSCNFAGEGQLTGGLLTKSASSPNDSKGRQPDG